MTSRRERLSLNRLDRLEDLIYCIAMDWDLLGICGGTFARTPFDRLHELLWV